MVGEIDTTEVVKLRVEPTLPASLCAKYEVLAELGQGGMASVYKARHRLTEQVVAIKILHEQTETSLKRFKQEASIAVNLSHPNVVAVFDFDIADNIAYLVMEYVDGTTVADVLKQDGRIGLERFERIISDVCAGLEYAHSLGVVHRDIKPANILLARSEGREVAKLADFGIAKSAGEQQQHLTQTGEVIGTPLYMSPEQCMGQPASKQSDVYALGCVMHEMLSGQPPLVGSNFLETVHRRVHERPENFAEALAVPLHIQRAVLDCLEQQPANRPESAGAVSGLIAGGCLVPIVRTDNRFPSRLIVMATIALALSVVGYVGGRWLERVSERAESSANRHSDSTDSATALPLKREQLQQFAVDAFARKDLPLAERAFTKLAGDSDKAWRAGALEYLALIKIQRNDKTEAKALSEEAADLWRQQYGDRSSYSAYGDITAATRLLELQSPTEAERHLDRAFAVLLRSPKDDNFKVQCAGILAAYRILYERDGRLDQFEKKRKALQAAAVGG